MIKADKEDRLATETAFKIDFQFELQAARRTSLEKSGLRSRGIVIPAGGARMFTCAWVAVRMLRDFLKTSLPIQIWHIGPEELSPTMATLLAQLNVETVDATKFVTKDTEIGGFELKSLALLKCPFQEALLMDADNVPLIDPIELFEHPSFRDTGAIFWPDLVSISKASRIWDLCDVQYRSMPSLESGQLVIDRVRHYSALSLSWFLNKNSHLVYQHIYGDKDCFLLAWLALGNSFYLVQHNVERLYGCLCQHHPDGRRMFQHRNGRKWKLFGENPTIAGFAEEDTCLAYLAELKRCWNGRVFIPPPYDDDLLSLASTISEQRFFRLETVSIGIELIEFHPQNLLIRNNGSAAYWWLERYKDDIMLVIGDDQYLNRKFKSRGALYWRSVASPFDSEQQILSGEHDRSSLTVRGHNTQSVLTTLKNWQRNYDDTIVSSNN